MYLEVDSYVEDQPVGSFDLAPVVAAGLQGWQIPAVIPRTVGVPLFNQHSEGFPTNRTYGAGVGGNVVGVCMVLSRAIRGPLSDAQLVNLQDRR